MTFLYRQKLKAPNIKINSEASQAAKTPRMPPPIVKTKMAVVVVSWINNPVIIVMPNEKKTVAVINIKLILNPMIKIQNSMNLLFDFFNANIKTMSATITVNDQIGPAIPPGNPIKSSSMKKRRKP